MADEFTKEDAKEQQRLKNRLYYITHRDKILAKAKERGHKHKPWHQRSDNPKVKKLIASAKYHQELADSKKLRALAKKITKVPETVKRYTTEMIK